VRGRRGHRTVSWHARGFSAVTIGNGTGLLERALRALGKRQVVMLNHTGGAARPRGRA
jgi:hypothetical protein